MKHESGTGQRRQGPQIDFQFWARKAYWHPVEAAALSLPIDPEYLRFLSPDEYDNSEEYVELRDRCDLVERQCRVQNKPLGLSPSATLEWAATIGLEMPQALKKAVQATGQSVDDWRTKYEKERESNLLLRADAEKARRETEKFRNDVEQLTSVVERLKNQDARKTLQKLALGMAIVKYNYAVGSNAPRRIADDLATDESLERFKTEVHADTIRKYLQEAREELEK